MPLIRRFGFVIVLFCTLQSAKVLAANDDAPTNLNSPEINLEYARYDWVPEKELGDRPRGPTPTSCCGAYVDPMSDVVTAGELAEEPIFIEADSCLMTTTNITLEGKVEISQASRKIKANFMAFDQLTDKAELSDNVEIRQTDLLLRGEKATVNMAGREASFSESEFVVHSSHLRGSAENIEHLSDGKVVLTRGQLTSCEPGRESWVIKGKQLSINPKTNMGTGRNITIELAGVPILYTPYIAFPMGDARQSGFLTPIAGTSEGGIDITIPWYWNIAPNYDATLAPRFAAGHGAMLESELRHLSHRAEDRLSLTWLPDDRGGGDPDVDKLIKQGADENLLRPYAGSARWLLDYDHKGGRNERWYTSVNFTRVSDVDYFRDLSTESFSIINNTSLSQQAILGYHMPNWHLSAKFQTYQNLLVDVKESYRQLPRVNANGRYNLGSWYLNMENEWTWFDHPEENYISGQRLNVDYSLEHNKQWLSGFVQTKLGMQSLLYNLNNDNLLTQKDNSPTVATPYASLDAGLFFERAGGQQTFEPRLFYLYRKYADHSDLLSVIGDDQDAPRDVNFDTTLLTFSYDQLFRGRRFAGGDRLGDADQLTLGFTSRLMNESLSQTQASVSLGKVLYFSDRRVFLNSSEQAQTIEDSDIAGNTTFKVRENVQLRADFLYNPSTEKLIRTTTGVEFQDNHQRRIKFNYHYVREDEVEQSTLPVNQLDTAAILPIGEQWQLLGRIFYDLDEHKELDAFIGFEYDNCCYRVRLLARRWLDSKLADLVDDETLHYDNSVSLEIDLKGLASSGNSIQKLLKQTLPGFRD